MSGPSFLFFLLLMLLIIQRRELQPSRHSKQNPLHSKNPLQPLQRFQPQRCCLRFQRFLQSCYRKKRKILQLRQQKQKLTSSFSLTFKLLNNLFPLKTLQRYTLFPIYSPYFASFFFTFLQRKILDKRRGYAFCTPSSQVRSIGFLFIPNRSQFHLQSRCVPFPDCCLG